MNEQAYVQALSHQLDLIAGFSRTLAAERKQGTHLGVRQYEQLLKRLHQELDELMALAPEHSKHEVTLHHET